MIPTDTTHRVPRPRLIVFNPRAAAPASAKPALKRAIADLVTLHKTNPLGFSVVANIIRTMTAAKGGR